MAPTNLADRDYEAIYGYLYKKNSAFRIEHVVNNKDFMDRAYFQLKKVYIPKRCALSNEWMWTGTEAYFGMYGINGPAGEPPLIIRKWVSKEAFMMHQLTK